MVKWYPGIKSSIIAALVFISPAQAQQEKTGFAYEVTKAAVSIENTDEPGQEEEEGSKKSS